MRKVHEDKWDTDVPVNNYASEAHPIQLAHCGRHAGGVSLSGADVNRRPGGSLLSRRTYWLRVLQMLADATTRREWQAAPVAEPLTQTGPWLRPQIEANPTKLQSSAQVKRTSTKEAEVTATVENTGAIPAYPVALALLPMSTR